MGQAYQDGGKWWVPWGKPTVPCGAECRGSSGKWGPSGYVGRAPHEGCEYRVPATQEQIDEALRAESGASVTEVRPDGSAVVTFTINPTFTNPDGWIEKSWGRTRQVFAAEGVEVWESEGKAGHRTSLHRHPIHMQQLSVISGDLRVHNEGTNYCPTMPQRPGSEHEIRFISDCRFIEVYTGFGKSVADSIERIYK